MKSRRYNIIITWSEYDGIYPIAKKTVIDVEENMFDKIVEILLRLPLNEIAKVEVVENNE